jgi:hypothetical protein
VLSFGGVSPSASVHALWLNQFDASGFSFTRLTALLVSEEASAGVERIYIGRAQASDHSRGQIVTVVLVRPFYCLSSLLTVHSAYAESRNIGFQCEINRHNVHPNSAK